MKKFRLFRNKSHKESSATLLDQYVEKEDFNIESPHSATLRMLLRDLATQKVIFFKGLFFVLLGTMMTLSEPKILGEVIDRVIIPKKLEWIKWGAAFYFITIVLRIFSIVTQAYTFEKLAQEMMQQLRMKLFKVIHAFPLKTFDTTPIGRLITRLTNDTAAMNEMFSSGFILLVGNFLFIFGSLIVLFFLNWRLALIGLSPFPLLLFFSVKFSQRLIHLYRETRMRMSSINAFLAENILGMKVVQLFSVEREHLDVFHKTNNAHFQSRDSSIRIYSYFQPLITWCSGLSAALLLYFGAKKVILHEISPGILVSFLGYCIALFNPIRDFVDRWTVFLSGLSSAERIYALFEWEKEKEVRESLPDEEAFNAADLRHEAEIEFRNVSFSYNDFNSGTLPKPSDWVLKNFSLKIKKGEKIGVVGHTGAGKSTLISLLLRAYHPQKGSIYLNGVDINKIPLKTLRKYFGLIQQDVFLFSGTLLENITLFQNPETIKSDTVEKINELFMRFNFSKPLHFRLEERGSNLSQGEKQMVSYIRAFIHHPDFFILDEPTSNIDSHTEEKIMKSLLSEALGVSGHSKSCLMIAHRLSTVKNLDRILVLHKGELMEEGSHDVLISKKGLYYHLLQLD